MSSEYDSSKIGITQETSSKTDWKSILNDRQKDNIIFRLMEDVHTKYITKYIKESKEEEANVLKTKDDISFISIMIKEFLDLLKSKKLSSSFEYSIDLTSPETVKGGKKKVDKKNIKKMEMMKKMEEERMKKTVQNIHERIFSIQIKDNTPIIKNNKFDLFFTLLYWACYLLKKENYIIIEFYICTMSLYRSIHDMGQYFDEKFIQSCYVLLNALEEKMKVQKNDKYYETLFKNEFLFIDNYWSSNVENGIELYPEQRKVIDIVCDTLRKESPLLLMYKLPPSQGKTVLAAPLSKIIAHQFPNKIFLYICYSDIVRMDVARLANSQGVDIHFWMAKTHHDIIENKSITLFDPFKKCYKKWDQKTLRNPIERRKFNEKREKERPIRESQDLNIQMEYYLNETIKDYPEMIIADQESAYRILETFGDMIIPYFDEPTATADKEITSRIMSVLPKVSILVSATLPDLEEIPFLYQYLKTRHSISEDDDSYCQIVSSNKQHIGCCIVDPEGFIYLPHYSIHEFEMMEIFLERLKKDPLKLRAYIPESVYDMAVAVKQKYPEDRMIHFENRFLFLGDIHYESIRNYAIELLQFIWDKRDEPLLRVLQSIKTQKMKNMDPYALLTTNSLFYKDGNALHISSANGFQEHVHNMAEPLLRDSPDNMNAIESFCQSQLDSIQSERERIEKYASLQKDDTDADMRMLEEKISNMKIGWSSEYLVNSRLHASKFGNLILESKSKMIIDPEQFIEINRLLDPLILKLMLSGVGVYHPENGDTTLSQLFLKNISKYHISLSTPAIIYGANMSIQCIDFDSSYTVESTRNTIYQGIGRVGRGGGRCMKEAMAVFRDYELLNKAMDIEHINIEASILEQMVQEIISRGSS